MNTRHKPVAPAPVHKGKKKKSLLAAILILIGVALAIFAAVILIRGVPVPAADMSLLSGAGTKHPTASAENVGAKEHMDSRAAHLINTTWEYWDSRTDSSYWDKIHDNGEYRYYETDEGITLKGYQSDTAEVVLPSEIDGKPVVALGDDLCLGMNNLTHAVLPKHLTRIGKHAFAQCETLTTVEIPESVTVIDDNAFSDCSGLDGIYIPSGVRYIGAGAFYNCTLAPEIKLEKLEYLGCYAFGSCIGEYLFIPKTATYINPNAFSYSKIYELEISDENPNYKYDGCALFSKDGSYLYDWNPQYAEGPYVIPADVRYVSNEALENAFRESDSVDSAFALDPNSQYLKIENRTLMSSDGTILFAVLPDYRDWISAASNGADDGRSYTVPDGVTDLGWCAMALRDFEFLNIRLPESLVNIGDGALAGNSITSITLPEGLKTLGRQAFLGCSELFHVSIPGSVTYIEPDTFENCKVLAEIKLSEGVTEIGHDAFSILEKLSFISLPSTLERIGPNAFAYCNALSDAVLPDGLIEIGSGAFQECTSYDPGHIPSTVQSIGPDAFSNCTAITDLVIPASVKTIGDGAFDGCSNLVIHAARNSAAQEYAEEHGIPIVLE